MVKHCYETLMDEATSKNSTTHVCVIHLGSEIMLNSPSYHRLLTDISDCQQSNILTKKAHKLL